MKWIAQHKKKLVVLLQIPISTLTYTVMNTVGHSTGILPGVGFVTGAVLGTYLALEYIK